jgi:hypothetical protein
MKVAGYTVVTRRTQGYIAGALVLLISGLLGSNVGTVRGKVVDQETGSPLPGVNVYIVGTSMGAATDDEGEYYIINVPVGTYDLRATMIGYKTITQRNVKVIRDQTQWVNFRMVRSVLEGESVEVIAERPLVEKDVTGKKVVVSEEEITTLPVRDLTELYTLQSGIVEVKSVALGIPGFEDRGIEQIHVRGGRANETGFMVDGLYIENPIYGGKGKGTRLNQYAVREVDFQTGFFNAEYGDAMSGLVNNVTRSGDERFSSIVKLENYAPFFRRDRIRGYNKFAGGFGGPVPLLGEKYRYWISWDRTVETDRVLKFDDKVYRPGDPGNRTNHANRVNILDRFAGWQAFGFDTTFDVFTRFDWHVSDQIRLAATYWNLYSRFQVFSPFYLYYTKGRNVVTKRSRRGSLEWRHQLSQRTFYTIRMARFIQESDIGVRNYDSDGDGYPDWLEQRLGSDPYNRATNDPANYYPLDVNGERLEQYIDEFGNVVWSIDDPLNPWLTPDQYNQWMFQSYPDSTYDYYIENFSRSTADSLYYLFYIEFLEGGADRYWQYVNSTTDEIRIDLQSQVTKRHQVRLGIDVKRHLLTFDEVQLPWLATPYTERYGVDESYGYMDSQGRLWSEREDTWRGPLDLWVGKPGRYTSQRALNSRKKPLEWAAYLQDKFEIPKKIVVNAGIRVDATNTRSKFWRDPNQPTADSTKLVDSDWVIRVSPRLGFSHVITDRSTFNFGYGVYYMNPTYRNMYLNSDEVGDSTTFFNAPRPLVGNSLMESERVVEYEFGVKSQFAAHWAYNVIAWSKDYSNLTATEEVRAGQVSYTVFKNYDYGSARGIDFLLQKAGGGDWSMTVQYTIMRATANRADPWQGYRSSDNPLTMPKKEVLMSYDRTHHLTTIFSYRIPAGAGRRLWGWNPLSGTLLTFTSTLLSGAPYTPIDPATNRPKATNSERMPWYFNMSLAFRKYISLGFARITLGGVVQNLLDRRNPIDIYPHTGSPTDPGRIARNYIESGYLSSTYYDRPWYFDRPRTIDLFVEVAL